MKLEEIGKMAYLQDDMSPLQLGSQGTFDGKKFEVIGRLKVGYHGGFWNEWYAMFASENYAWLAEAQGFYAMCFEQPGAAVPPMDKVFPGCKVRLTADETFDVVDILQAYCLYSEGELPLNAKQGRQSLSVDLSGQDDRMATIEYAEARTRVYIGSYQEYDDFHFTQVRRFDGW